jgi:pimeloyl-ACP methyl ester carboxylesterase
MQTAVHQLWPPPGDMRKTEMNILFFHSYPRDPDEWKSAWTQRSHPDVCWPEKWLPADLGFDVRVMFVSYNIGQSRAADVVDDLFKALVIRDEWDLCKNHQPLVLVGRGFGTLVLDNLFLKATEEVLTSPTEAGAFVRNVRGVILYGDDDKSYKIEKLFGGRSEHIERVRAWTSSFRLNYALFITQGSILINPAIYGKNLTRDVRIYSTYTNSESSCGVICL